MLFIIARQMYLSRFNIWSSTDCSTDVSIESYKIQIFKSVFHAYPIYLCRVSSLTTLDIYKCKVVIYNYFVLDFIPCQIWLQFCSILCTLYFMWDFFVRVVCERECEDSRQSEEQEVFAGSSPETFLRSEAYALHITKMWRVMTDGDS